MRCTQLWTPKNMSACGSQIEGIQSHWTLPPRMHGMHGDYSLVQRGLVLLPPPWSFSLVCDCVGQLLCLILVLEIGPSCQSGLLKISVGKDPCHCPNYGGVRPNCQSLLRHFRRRLCRPVPAARSLRVPLHLQWWHRRGRADLARSAA